MITDNEARYIASQWADGGDEFGVFASTGRIVPELAAKVSTTEGLERLQFDGDDTADELKDLYTYVTTHGPRDEVPGWGRMPECDREIADREAQEVWAEQERDYWRMRDDELREMRQY